MAAAVFGDEVPSPRALDAAQYLEAIEGPRAAKSDEEDATLTLDALLDKYQPAGLAIAVWHDDAVTWEHQIGLADRATGEPVTRETLFQAASISKPMGALATLQLVDEGLLDLDRDVNEYLTSWQLPRHKWSGAKEVTLRGLLSHTAGTGVPSFPGYAEGKPAPTAREVLQGAGVTNTKPLRVTHEPRTREEYSGGGSTLVQVLLEDVTGERFEDLLQNRVLEPAGMTSSTFAQPPSGLLAERTARANPSRRRVLEARYHVYPEQFAAGLWTTAGDLALAAIGVQRALRGEESFVSQQVARWATRQEAIGSFALGFNTQERGTGDEQVWYFTHSGGNWGFQSNLVARRDADYGGYGSVVMMSSAGAFPLILEIQRRIALAAGWEGDLTQWPRNWPSRE